MSFDVVIVSKDRYSLLLRQIERVKDKISYNKIIVIDSTEIIPKFIHDFYKSKEIEYYHTPNAKLGYARQRGLSKVNTEYFFMIDDDITFEKDVSYKMYNRMINYDKDVAYTMYNRMINYSSNVFALSPIILFGTNKDILSVYMRKKKDVEGVSSGYCMINTDIVRKLGGFNINIHVGEDAELFYRAKKNGYNWIRLHDVYVNHPCTNSEFIFRTWNHRRGMMFSVKYGFDTYFSLILKRVRDMFLNLLSFIRHRNYKTTMFLMCNDFISLITYVWGMINV